jgi:hypothetical protein
MSCARLTLGLLVASVLAVTGLFLGVCFGVSSAAGMLAARGLFALTLAVEGVAFGLALAMRSRYQPGEPNRRIWTLFAIFLGVRLLAQLRLASIYFDLVPGFVADSGSLKVIYISGLRYLYTLSDLCFTGALVVAIRAWRATGLPFRALGRDYAMMVAVGLLAVATWALAGNLDILSQEFQNVSQEFKSVDARQMQIFRLVAVSLGTLIACLCLVVRRYAVQMGGGALAGIWSAVVVAGIAHAASFLMQGALSRTWQTGAEFFEQLFLFIFAGSFMLASLRQRELHRTGQAQG